MSALLDRWGTDCIGSQRGERGGGRGQVGCAVVVGGQVGCADVAEGVVRAGGKCSSERGGVAKNLISEAKFPVTSEPFLYLQHIERIGANSQY